MTAETLSEQITNPSIVDSIEKKKKKKKKPLVSVPCQFKDNVYPIGELQQYKDYVGSTVNEELMYEQLNDLRRAAEVHRQVLSLILYNTYT
jgi:hypothetical protein